MTPVCFVHAMERKLQAKTKGRSISHCLLERSFFRFVNANFARWDLENGWPNSKSTVNHIMLWWCFFLISFLTLSVATSYIFCIRFQSLCVVIYVYILLEGETSSQEN